MKAEEGPIANCLESYKKQSGNFVCLKCEYGYVQNDLDQSKATGCIKLPYEVKFSGEKYTAWTKPALPK